MILSSTSPNVGSGCKVFCGTIVMETPSVHSIGGFGAASVSLGLRRVADCACVGLVHVQAI